MMRIMEKCRRSYKHFAQSTVLASTLGALLPCASSFSPSIVHASPASFLSKSNRSFRNHHASSSTFTGAPASPRTRHFSSLSNPDEQAMKRDAMEIIQDAIQAVDPYKVIRSNIVREDNTLHLKKENLKLDLDKDYDEIILVAFGKASSAMSTSILEQVFPKDFENSKIGTSCKGVVICKDGHVTDYEKEVLSCHGIEIYEASHPVPDSRSVEAADRLIDMVSSNASERTLVLCCISGGGSALFCRPSHPLTLDDLQQVNSILLASGMGIQEMNVLRKRLEDGKGGRLAASCFPSDVVALILSDVIGDPLDLIASGPTVPDQSSWEDGWNIVQKYNLEEELPAKVVEMLREGLEGTLEDSPSSDHAIFERSKNLLVGNNDLAVEAASETAKRLGYQPVVLGTEIEGEAKEVAKIYTAMSSHLQKMFAKKSEQAENPFVAYTVAQSLPVALIAGGESTVSLTPNSGKGGRNQELALSAAVQLDSMGMRNVVLASVGTDGGDGPTDAAGAVVDATTTRSTRSEALEALSNHNAYPYLDSLESPSDVPPPLIKTGPTGTNVADICVTLIKPKPGDEESIEPQATLP